MLDFSFIRLVALYASTTVFIAFSHSEILDDEASKLLSQTTSEVERLLDTYKPSPANTKQQIEQLLSKSNNGGLKRHLTINVVAIKPLTETNINNSLYFRNYISVSGEPYLIKYERHNALHSFFFTHFNVALAFCFFLTLQIIRNNAAIDQLDKLFNRLESLSSTASHDALYDLIEVEINANPSLSKFKKNIATLAFENLKVKNAINRSLKTEQTLSEEKESAKIFQRALDRKDSELKKSEELLMELVHESITPLSASAKQADNLLRRTSDKHLIYALKNLRDTISLSGTLISQFSKSHLSNQKTTTLEFIWPRSVMESAVHLAKLNFSRPGKSGRTSIITNPHGTSSLSLMLSDDSKLTQILLNLYKNALKYGGGSDVTISVSENLHPTDKSLRQFTFEVEDNGPGFPQNILNDWASERKRRGGDDYSFGIGLSLVRNYLRELDSTLILGNRVDRKGYIKGAYCQFTLTTKYQTNTATPLAGHTLGLYSNDTETQRAFKNLSEDIAVSRELLASDLSYDHATILLIEYGAELDIEELRDASSIEEGVSTIIVCEEEDYQDVVNGELILPYTIDGVEYDNIFAISKPITLTGILNELGGNIGDVQMTSLNANILLAEDNESQSTALLELLGRSCKITHVNTLAGATTALKENRYDIFITDYNFENENLTNQISKIRALIPNTPILLHTASAKRSVEEALKFCDGYINKSENTNKLIAEINRFISGEIASQHKGGKITLQAKKADVELYFKHLRLISEAANENDLGRFIHEVHALLNICINIQSTEWENLKQVELRAHKERKIIYKDVVDAVSVTTAILESEYDKR